MLAGPDAFGHVAAALGRPGAASSDFDLNPAIMLPAGRRLSGAAVLVALTEGPAGLEVILTKRSSRLRHHPGQIALPGGKIDPGDVTPEAAAIREAREEIGLPDRLVRIIGRLPPHETVTGFEVTPVVAEIGGAFDAVLEAGEVEEIFQVPMAHLAGPGNYRIESRLWRGQRRHYFVVPWGPYYIWGATARILRGLAERLAS